jgi:hypothetical protein
MDNLKVDLSESSFASNGNLGSADSGAGRWTEAMMRELLAEVPKGSFEELLREANQRESERSVWLEAATERLYQVILSRRTGELVDLLCDLPSKDLRDVVARAAGTFQRNGLRSVDIRVDDFDRIVLFDQDKNRGFAIAASGSYQRVSRFYDSSYRYGLEVWLDDSMFETVEAVFDAISEQLVGH